MTRVITGSQFMVALDNTAILGRGRVPVPKISLVGGIALAAAVVAFGSVAAHGFSDEGYRLAGLNAWRFAFFIFFAALVAGPLGRLIPSLRRLEEDSCKLFWGFCASYGVYLLAVLAPTVLGVDNVGRGQSAATTLFVLFGAAVTVVMALALTPRMGELAGGGARRALLGVSAIYFWTCYALMGLSYISRPHRPDDFYALSLCLMIVALLTRFADRLAGDWRRPAARPA
jgi:MFS family permease